MSTNLKDRLSAIDWSQNIATFAAQPVTPKIETAIGRISKWALQFERLEANNPALAFIREMQVQSHHAVVCLALGLYKPTASGLRAFVECALYYSYFRVHHAELATLARASDYFVTKEEIVEFHKTHTPGWSTKEQSCGFNGRLREWYSQMSRVIHGQIPGSWLPEKYKGISDLRRDNKLEGQASQALIKGADLVHDLFLITVSKDIWTGFEAAAKVDLLKGLSPKVKEALALTVV